jgi:hypothetical protein
MLTVVRHKAIKAVCMRTAVRHVIRTVRMLTVLRHIVIEAVCMLTTVRRVKIKETICMLIVVRLEIIIFWTWRSLFSFKKV